MAASALTERGPGIARNARVRVSAHRSKVNAKNQFDATALVWGANEFANSPDVK
jgi:hypothetical protein